MQPGARYVGILSVVSTHFPVLSLLVEPQTAHAQESMHHPTTRPRPCQHRPSDFFTRNAGAQHKGQILLYLSPRDPTRRPAAVPKQHTTKSAATGVDAMYLHMPPPARAGGPLVPLHSACHGAGPRVAGGHASRVPACWHESCRSTCIRLARQKVSVLTKSVTVNCHCVPRYYTLWPGLGGTPLGLVGTRRAPVRGRQ